MTDLDGILSRRDFLIGAGALSVVSGTSSIAGAQRKISYLDALLGNGQERQEWINQVVFGNKPEYVLSVQYATPEIFQELKTKYGYIPLQGAYAATMPVESDKISRGTKSRIYVFPEAFSELYKKFPQLHNDLDVIISNVILKNEFTDAKHFSLGIPAYPIDLFRKQNGEFNRPLYLATIEMLSYHAEYSGLLEKERVKPSKFLQQYLLGIRQLAQELYGLFLSPPIITDMDLNLIKKLQNELNPKKLFKTLN